MSSNLLTKEIDWNKYDLVYAGAQKNVGPAGVTIVIVRSTLVKGHRSDTPLICDWELFSKAQNMFHNTPACFPIYMCGLNLAYIIEQGGVPAMKAMAEKRSELLYDCIDSSDGYYINQVDPKYRSRINIPFRVCFDAKLEAQFLEEAAQSGLIDLKGFRTVGGCRASLYSAMPLEGVHALVNFMNDFKQRNPRQPARAKL